MKHAIALDIGGTNIKYALVDQNGFIHFESLKPVKSEYDKLSIVSLLKTIIRDVLNIANANQTEIVGIGIGVPSVVDNGVVLFANNLPELDNINVKAIIKEEFGLPVFVDNDANLMGLGEVKYGTAGSISDAVFLTVGTGIGGALILNGQLYGGYRNRGTELGFLIVDSNKSADTCGTAGSLEAMASVTALINDYKKILAENNHHPDTNIDGKYIIAKYLENEPCAITAMNNHFYYMAVGIASLINVFAPQKVIIGGGISEAGDFYCEKISALVNKMAMKETSEFTRIELASLGNKAGFLGAAALIFNNRQTA
ncbi:ROK family protein [Danxiaibacter flavus]|uniref:ROK family protein n=1 Tax=Danxiaibacter flavus TaxID=3049108 RepID=A0ABV3ZD52_9BACT|nr:ROK family protein [Chitinophagaceae bacterium DXS]